MRCFVLYFYFINKPFNSMIQIQKQPQMSKLVAKVTAPNFKSLICTRKEVLLPGVRGSLRAGVRGEIQQRSLTYRCIPFCVLNQFILRFQVFIVTSSELQGSAEQKRSLFQRLEMLNPLLLKNVHIQVIEHWRLSSGHCMFRLFYQCI